MSHRPSESEEAFYREMTSQPDPREGKLADPSVEWVARALYEEFCEREKRGLGPWEDFHEIGKEDWRGAARAAIAAMSGRPVEAGLTPERLAEALFLSDEYANPNPVPWAEADQADRRLYGDFADRVLSRLATEGDG